MQMTRRILESLLTELGDWLEFEDCAPVDWVVCGGVALSLQDLQSRTTRDVDVLGNWGGATIACIQDFPDEVKACIRKVVENHPDLQALDMRWINLGPSRLATFGLPEGFERRLTSVSFGKKLTLHLLGRQDLLPLKLYAAADEFGRRQEVHYQDLKALRPTFDELDNAVDWVRTLPDFEEKRMTLKDIVGRLGYDDLAYYI